MSHCLPNIRTSSANCPDWLRRLRRTGRLRICARRWITSVRASGHNDWCGEATGQSSIWREDMPNGSLPPKPCWPICHLTKRQTSAAAMRRASISQAADDGHVEDDSLTLLQGAKRAAMPRSKPARYQRSDRTGARCRSTAGSWSRERRFFAGCQPERRSGSCLRAGWQATRCRRGSPPA